MAEETLSFYLDSLITTNEHAVKESADDHCVCRVVDARYDFSCLLALPCDPSDSVVCLPYTDEESAMNNASSLSSS